MTSVTAAFRIVECVAPSTLAVLLALAATALPAQAQQDGAKKTTLRSESPKAASRLPPLDSADDADADAPSDPSTRRRDGTIVRIDRDQLFFDLGTAHGMAVGQTLTVMRTITAKHPVTGLVLIDHFPLGSLRIEGVGSVLSFGRVERRIIPLLQIGDLVRSAAAQRPESAPGAGGRGTAVKVTEPKPNHAGKSASTTPPAVVTPTAPSQPSENAAELEARRAFQSTYGRPLPERIATLETFLSTHKDSPYRGGMESELAQLRTIRDTIERAADIAKRQPDDAVKQESPAREPPKPEIPVAKLAVPSRLYEGEPIEVAIYLSNPQVVRASWVYLRRKAARTYERIPFIPDGDGYLRVRLPKDQTYAGTLEYFVILMNSQFQTYSLGGNAQEPASILIDPKPAPLPPPGPDHSALRGFFEFVDFNRFYGNDYFFKGEADFMYRLGGILYSVRTGFGTLSGLGESVHNLDDLGLAPRPVGINYGYVEGELRFHRLVGIAVRGLAGQTKSGAGGGAELKLRIGSELGTNLVIGGAIISDFGALAQLQLEWNVIRNWPMSVTVVATNQPVQTDLGVRLIYQVGWRVRKWIAPTARIGYDVRNINHGGLSLGLGLVASW